ncbi:hypothetical protein BH10ACI1_BH10ACI1_21500 [soil metagenome]
MASGNLTAVSDGEGRFSQQVPVDALSVKFSDSNIEQITRIFAPIEKIENLQIKISYIVPRRSILAAGNDVVDFALSKRLKKWVDFNFSIDNLLNKKYYETQNYFESRVCPTCDSASEIHFTPGYPLTISFGLTFRLFAKE